MINVYTTISRKSISENKAIKSVSRVLQGKKFITKVNYTDYAFEVEKDFFYPYWIAEIYTRKERVLFKPKRITFFVICDALHEEYIVLRGMPKLCKIDCNEKFVLPAILSSNDFNQVIKEAQKDRIDRQYIFGKPYKEVKNIYLIHIPFFKVVAEEKKNQKKKVFYVNSYTGEVKVS